MSALHLACFYKYTTAAHLILENGGDATLHLVSREFPDGCNAYEYADKDVQKFVKDKHGLGSTDDMKSRGVYYSSLYESVNTGRKERDKAHEKFEKNFASVRTGVMEDKAEKKAAAAKVKKDEEEAEKVADAEAIRGLQQQLARKEEVAAAAVAKITEINLRLANIQNSPGSSAKRSNDGSSSNGSSSSGSSDKNSKGSKKV